MRRQSFNLMRFPSGKLPAGGRGLSAALMNGGPCIGSGKRGAVCRGNKLSRFFFIKGLKPSDYTCVGDVSPVEKWVGAREGLIIFA